MPYLNEQLRDCAAREVAQRKRVYPRLIENKRITQAFADEQTRQMEAIEQHFAKLADGERLL